MQAVMQYEINKSAIRLFLNQLVLDCSFMRLSVDQRFRRKDLSNIFGINRIPRSNERKHTKICLKFSITRLSIVEQAIILQ